MSEGWYDRQFVKEINAIFGHPKPPERVTEQQIDGLQSQLEEASQVPWHEFTDTHYSYYYHNLAYLPTQQALFDYLFPACLLLWREGLTTQLGGPYMGSTFYKTVFTGETFFRMMDHYRRRAVFDWMAEAFIEMVDSWSGELGHSHFILSNFNAIGQSIPLIPVLWEHLAQVSTPGRAQFWFVLATGLAYPLGEIPTLEPQAPDHWGGSICLTTSEAEMSDSGYLDPPNLAHMRANLNLRFLSERLEEAQQLTTPPALTQRLPLVLDRINNTEYPGRKLEWFLEVLGKPGLGEGLSDYSDEN